eukprot:357433-Chlamydomonas_euryale.AAC.3
MPCKQSEAAGQLDTFPPACLCACACCLHLHVLPVQLVTRHLVRLLETTDNISTLDFATYAIQTLLQVCVGRGGGGVHGKRYRALAPRCHFCIPASPCGVSLDAAPWCRSPMRHAVARRCVAPSLDTEPNAVAAGDATPGRSTLSHPVARR